MVLQAFIFVLLTWLALGIRTGLWDVRYFLAVPVMLVHFVVFLSVSAFIAVWTRSAVACALGTLVVWIACFALNLARHDAVLAVNQTHANAVIETAYWIAPKPLDYNLILTDALRASDYFGAVINVNRLNEIGGFLPELSMATGLLFAAGMLTLASRRLSRIDY